MSAISDFQSLNEVIEIDDHESIPDEQVSQSQKVLSQKRLPQNLSDTEPEVIEVKPTSASILKRITNLNRDVTHLENRLERLHRERDVKEHELARLSVEIKEDKQSLVECWKAIRLQHVELDGLKTPESSDKEVTVPSAPKKVKREYTKPQSWTCGKCGKKSGKDHRVCVGEYPSYEAWLDDREMDMEEGRVKN